MRERGVNRNNKNNNGIMLYVGPCYRTLRAHSGRSRLAAAVRGHVCICGRCLVGCQATGHPASLGVLFVYGIYIICTVVRRVAWGCRGVMVDVNK